MVYAVFGLIRVMLKIMKQATNKTSGTFILLWCVLHWIGHFFRIRKNDAETAMWEFIIHVS